MLQKVLQGTGSPKLKAQALFVLAQSNSPKAREVLVNIAKGNGNPDLQMRAVRYLGDPRRPREPRGAGRDLRLVDRRRHEEADPQRLHAGRREGPPARPRRRREQNPELRATAVQQLGNMGAHEELWALYQKESVGRREEGDHPRALHRRQRDAPQRARAQASRTPSCACSRSATSASWAASAPATSLVEIYNSDKDPDIRKAVINGLANSNNAEALVALARKESGPDDEEGDGVRGSRTCGFEGRDRLTSSSC